MLIGVMDDSDSVSNFIPKHMTILIKLDHT